MYDLDFYDDALYLANKNLLKWVEIKSNHYSDSTWYKESEEMIGHIGDEILELRRIVHQLENEAGD